MPWWCEMVERSSYSHCVLKGIRHTGPTGRKHKVSVRQTLRRQIATSTRPIPEQLEDGQHLRAICAVQLRARDDDGPGEAAKTKR